MLFHYFFHLTLISSLHCQLFLRISGITKICKIKITSQCKILIVPEEGRFGQPKYSTYIKTILRCAGFCLYFCHIYSLCIVTIFASFQSRFISQILSFFFLSRYLHRTIPMFLWSRFSHLFDIFNFRPKLTILQRL